MEKNVIGVVNVIEVGHFTSKKGNPFAVVTFESELCRYPVKVAMFSDFEDIKVGDSVFLCLGYDYRYNATLTLHK